VLVGGPEGTTGTPIPVGCCHHPPAQVGSGAKLVARAGWECGSGGTCARAAPCPRAYSNGYTSPCEGGGDAVPCVQGVGRLAALLGAASCSVGSAWVTAEMAMGSSIHRVPGQWAWVLLPGAGGAPALALWHWWQHLPMGSHWPSFSSISRRDLDINRPGTVPNAKTLR